LGVPVAGRVSALVIRVQVEVVVQSRDLARSDRGELAHRSAKGGGTLVGRLKVHEAIFRPFAVSTYLPEPPQLKSAQ